MLINRLPGKGCALVALVVIWKDFTPVPIRILGGGVVNGSFKKKHPKRSPKLSVLKRIFETFAIALDDLPYKVHPISTLPKYSPSACLDIALVSIVKVVDDAE